MNEKQIYIHLDYDNFTYKVGYINTEKEFTTLKTFDRFIYTFFQVRAWVLKFVMNNAQYTW